ncbi:MAG: hypothetical protein HPY55_00075 [Firmicutes bacterium]|nr:hypothetical protein [Bacillota bacterium]
MPKARECIQRQRERIEAFAFTYGVKIDMWHIRAKGLVPIPTLEQMIEEGRVYAVIIAGWGRLGSPIYPSETSETRTPPYFSSPGSIQR